MQIANNEPKRRRAWGVTRISSEAQLEEGESLAQQQRAIELICELENFELMDVFADAAVSGSVPLADRPGGAKLLASVQKGDVVVCIKQDRLFRRADDALVTAALLRKRGVEIYIKDQGGFVRDNPHARFQYGIMSSVSELERELIASRIRDAKRDQRQRGRFLGGAHAPFGFAKVERQDSGKLKYFVEPIETIHTEAQRLRELGYSTRLAAGALRAHGYDCSHKAVGKLWRTMGL